MKYHDRGLIKQFVFCNTKDGYVKKENEASELC